MPDDLGLRVFRRLIRLYPETFQARFEDEMMEFYRERRSDHPGVRGAIRLWLHLIGDAAISVPRQHYMDNLRQDLRFAIRTLARHPGFAVVAALTLALGIGANTAIFSVVDAVILRPLPWPDDERLVAISTLRNGNQAGTSYLDYKDWREQSNAFTDVGVLRGQSVNFTGGETPERLIGQFVDVGMMRVLGASASQGRLFTNSETEVATKEPSAVISEALWRTRFGSQPNVLGSTMVLNGIPFTVVGIMRPGFTTPFGTPDVYMPIGYYPNAGDLENRGRGGVAAFGKMRAGVSIETAQANLEGIATRIAEQYPATNAGTTVGLQSLKEVLVGPSRAPLFIVLASVGVVLLIACANVANLQLARATARRRELTVRAALGAGRHRLVRQLLTENIVLSMAGGIGGLLIAWAGVRWFASVTPTLFPVSTEVTLSQGVLLFAGLVTLATALVFGLAPAWSATRTRLSDTLALRGDTGVSRLRAHNAVVVAQVALCVVLLVSAGLLTRSLMALSRVDPGFDARQVLTMQFRLPASTYDTQDKIATMFTRTIDEVRAVAGVRHAALVRATPLNGNGELLPYAIEGTAIEPERLPRAHLNIVSSDFFETMKIPTRAGRDFESGDQRTTMPVAIVNEQLAIKVAPSGSAIGKRVRLSPTDTTTKWATIVGVVGNAKHFQVNEPQLDQIYVPYTQRALIFTELVVRSDGDPNAVANAVRAAIWRVDRDQPVWAIRPLMVSIERQLGGRTFTMRLLAAFAILAVVLALIGVYGVMSYAVARRTQEMGIRMALGAGGQQVVRMVLAQGVRTVSIAIVIGLAASFGATRLLETQLFGVKSTDPLTFAIVPVALAIIAIAACYIPARRASRVDPLIALRSD